MPVMIPTAIIEESCVSQGVESYTSQYPRFEDLWIALTWRIAREPKCGQACRNGIHYILKSDSNLRQFGFPVITLMYRIESDGLVVTNLLVVP
jgi:hypothetical protein